MVVITREPPKRTGWEVRLTEQLQALRLGVDVPFIMVRWYQSPSSREYVEDSKALRDLISEVIFNSI